MKNCGNCKYAGIYNDNDMTDFICDNLKSNKHNYGVNKTSYCDKWEANKIQNWEVLQKKISEMSKEEFIKFARDNIFCDTLRYMLGVNVECGRCKYRYESGSADCKKVLLESEYQPPEQEKWIVHRTLRTQNKEVYISKEHDILKYQKYLVCHNCADDFDGYGENIFSCKSKELAYKFNLSTALRVRDLLNKDRVGKQYLWVTSRVEE